MKLLRRPAETNMTEGSIVKHLVTFALPLLIGSIFQQLYNTVDTWVVGNYVSNEAFSAVGSVSPICNMLIGFFTGLSSGAGVVISHFFGADRQDKVAAAAHTAAALTLILGVLFTGIGVGFTPLAVKMMNVPAEVAPDAKSYLTIYFSGIIGLMIYNMGSGILRAVGDSRRPFYFLAVSAVVNIVLDLLFVLRFGMEVEGVAYATIISQGISALLTVITLLTYKSSIRLRPSRIKIDLPILKNIITVGIPAALQIAITSFSNIFVMAYINHFGADCMSGWTAYSRIDQFIILPIQAFELATTTFIGQNLGAGQKERVKRGCSTAVVLGLAVTAAVILPLMFFAPRLTAFFNPKSEVVVFGTMFLRYISPFYLCCCVSNIYAAALRGAGNSRTPMIIVLCSFVLFRQIYLFVMANFISNAELPIAFAYPAGWILCSLLTVIYYRRVGFKRGFSAA